MFQKQRDRRMRRGRSVRDDEEYEEVAMETEEEPRQCYGPGCIEPSRQNSKYCSDECGLKLATKYVLLKVLPLTCQWSFLPVFKLFRISCHPWINPNQPLHLFTFSRLFEVLPPRIRQWHTGPCVAEDGNKQALEKIRHQQLMARQKLVQLDQRNRQLDALVARAKQLKILEEAEVHFCGGPYVSIVCIKFFLNWQDFVGLQH